MYIGVFFHVGLLVEPLSAVLAGIRSRVRMYEEMCRQCARAFEAFATLLALLQTTFTYVLKFIKLQM